MIIASCAICSYVSVIHFLLSINADDDRRKKKIQKLEREQGWNVFWNFSAWLIDVIISLDKPNIMFTTTNVPKLYVSSPAKFTSLSLRLRLCMQRYK